MTTQAKLLALAQNFLGWTGALQSTAIELRFTRNIDRELRSQARNAGHGTGRAGARA